MAELNLISGIYRSTRGFLDLKYSVANDAERDLLITNDLVKLGHQIYHVSDDKIYYLKEYPTYQSLVGVVWGAIADINGDELQKFKVANAVNSNEAVNKGQLDAVVSDLQGALIPQGNWNADTNTPDITTTIDTGYYWIVSVDGATDLGGITDWKVNDWAVKTATGWAKIDNTDKVTSVAGKTGVVTLDTSDIVGLNKAFIDALNINADKVDGLDANDLYSSKTAVADWNTSYLSSFLDNNTMSNPPVAGVKYGVSLGSDTPSNLQFGWVDNTSTGIFLRHGSNFGYSGWEQLASQQWVLSKNYASTSIGNTFAQPQFIISKIASNNHGLFVDRTPNAGFSNVFSSTDLAENSSSFHFSARSNNFMVFTVNHFGDIFTKRNILVNNTGTFGSTVQATGFKTATGTGLKLFLDNGTTKNVSDFVDKTTVQTITALKTFTTEINVNPTSKVSKYKLDGNTAIEYDDNSQPLWKLFNGVVEYDNNNSLFEINENVEVNGDFSANSLHIKNTSTVASLGVGSTGLIKYVTDATTVTYRAVATGGGSNFALVVFDGTNWIYH